MKTRTSFYIFLLIAFAMLRTFSALPPDAEASKMLVGSWVASREQYKGLTINGGFTFKRDGTFSSYGIFTHRDRKTRIEVKGKWSVKDGILIEELTGSDHPDLASVGQITRDTLLAVTKTEYRFRSEYGREYSYSRR